MGGWIFFLIFLGGHRLGPVSSRGREMRSVVGTRMALIILRLGVLCSFDSSRKRLFSVVIREGASVVSYSMRGGVRHEGVGKEKLQPELLGWSLIRLLLSETHDVLLFVYVLSLQPSAARHKTTQLDATFFPFDYTRYGVHYQHVVPRRKL
ncbi:hypothetical protein F5X96DRAFT_471433 [Biscogniauxia mediterranea]|nr:hypothetical protein F5X96DRAFT_471433 [Biscogniauxia mediterranea]